MKLTNLITFIFCSTLFFACTTNYDGHLDTISELSNNYLELNEKVSNINPKQSSQQLKKYESIIDSFKQKLNKDEKPSKETKDFINQFRSIKKTFKKTPKKLTFLKNSIKENTTQLKNLETDIKNNVFNENEIINILKQEKEALELLNEEYNNMTLEIKYQIEKFDSLIILSNNIEL